ncbi:MAG: nucleotide exchange factor GrpE [Streptosporangiaceae bacterium]
MSASEEESHGPVIRDRRRIDPVTGQPRQAPAADGSGAGETTRPDQARPGRHSVSKPGSPRTERAGQDGSGDGNAGEGNGDDGKPGNGKADDGARADGDLTAKLAERTADLQRVQAEYSNYRKRVDRDRTAVRELAVAGVLTELLPVLDDIGRAREHDELTGGFKAVADALEAAAGKLGLTTFGTAGEPFDPNIHEALMHSYSADVTEPACVQVLQPGYKVGERILRPARVAVAEPTDPAGARTGGDADEPAAADAGQAEGEAGSDEDQAPGKDD